MYKAYQRQLTDIVVGQNRRVIKPTKGLQQDYVSIIRKLYVQGQFSLVTKPRDFVEGYHDGVIYKEHLYLRPDQMEKKVRLYEPSAVSKEIVENLKECQVLDLGHEKTNKQLSGTGRGFRFCVIKLSVLNQ